MYCENKHVCWAHNHSFKVAFVIHSLQSYRQNVWQNSCNISTILSALSTFLYRSDFKLFEWVGTDFLIF